LLQNQNTIEMNGDITTLCLRVSGRRGGVRHLIQTPLQWRKHVKHIEVRLLYTNDEWVCWCSDRKTFENL